ncbi:tyrosine-protein phosphatase [Rhodococcus zopfii]|uniref:Tyrosine-protein phosphatase n=1 Tax=Rhodococcus zopfii TaxID=43772 RepID=A0ABU3WLM8_9NOCA|nr:tyrosine-protein phosphatase [Rhodococcus zopfii]
MTETVGEDAGEESTFAIPSLANLRDIGGCASRFGGEVRTGVVFRSTDLSRLTDTDRETLDALQITTVFDLRTAAEMERRPDRLPDGAVHVGLDVLADREDASVAAALPEIVANPDVVAKELSDGRAEQYLLGSYRDFVSMSSAAASYRRMAIGIAQGEVPALVHCSAGKDRTGWAAASLLLFAGADEDAVFADYLRTNDLLLPTFEPLFAKFRAVGGDPGLLIPLLGVQRNYLEASLDEVTNRYGTIEQYFAEGLRLDDDTLQTLRSRLVDTERAEAVRDE